MGYLFFQILIWILLAFGLGGIVGWLLRGFTHAFQDDEKGDDDTIGRGDDHIMVALLRSELNDYKRRLRALESATETARPGDEKPKREISDEWRPPPLSAPKGQADDLKKVRGIGPKIELTLNDLGIFHYDQIAGLSRENILWLNNHLHFPGRIEREQWVEQTRELAKRRAGRAEKA
ncbi:hypothetical protein [Sedimenticola hydrogenitrophicus]|uniref:hypothetical protein n=1 Tax=Sedimenticola hydrogenitrophicus TaxID=2967975 RepID=UPI0023AFC9EC|nr:hypothetical protein [Sedimenticola hydrogenitrophicus]